jgi:spore maturation protein SpmB
MNQNPVVETPESEVDIPVVSARAALPGALRKSFSVFLDLAKIVTPIYVVVAVLNYTGIVTSLARIVAPAMRIFGLPGEAAVPLFTGWFLSIYAAAGALSALHLSHEAITGVALMILLCHAIPMEWAVLQKMGARATRVTIIRFVLSLVVGLVYALIYHRQFTAPSTLPPVLQTQQALEPFIITNLLGCLKVLALILAIVVPVTTASEIARVTGVLPRFAEWLGKRMGRMAPGQGLLMALPVGLTFGIVYGGGAMIALSRTGAVKPEEARTVGLFLGLCHSLIDDPFFFVVMGGNVIWLYGARILMAIVLTPVLRRWA